MKVFLGIFLVVFSLNLGFAQIHVQGGATIISVSDTIGAVKIVTSKDTPEKRHEILSKKVEKKKTKLAIHKVEKSTPKEVVIAKIYFDAKSTQELLASVGDGNSYMVQVPTYNLSTKAISQATFTLHNKIKSTSYRQPISEVVVLYNSILANGFYWARPPPSLIQFFRLKNYVILG